MVQQKRTYSQRDKKQREYAEQDACRKCNKGDYDDELRWPGDRRPQGSSSLLKKGLRYSGPVSIPDDDEMDVDTVPNSNNRISGMFDKALGGKLKLIKPKQRSIYGSREDFEETMNDHSHSSENSAKPKNSHLPTPPTETEKQQTGRLKRFPPALNGHAAKLTSKGASPSIKPSETSQKFAKAIKIEQPKQPYFPKQYEANRTSAPRRNLLGDRMSKKSKETGLWAMNQTNSGFLRLPEEIRSRIYEDVLGRKTINICYETYHTTYKKDKPYQVTPVFRYHCSVYKDNMNPFHPTQPPVRISTGLTLLNNVCRQLYQETATLPYKFNLISFDSHLIFVNFILMEQRMSHQQRHAITRIIIRNDIPGANMLEHLPNLEKVCLAVSQVNKAQGLYEVIRNNGQEPKLVRENLHRYY